jgi:Flp pilus assembly CpaE family ATPase
VTSIGSHNNDGRSLRVRLIASAAETYNKIADILRTIDDPPVSIVDPEPGTFTPANADNQIDAIFVVPEAVERLDLPDLEAVSNQPRPTIVVLLGERETGAVRRAIRAGADEVMFLPLDQNDAIRTLLKISEARRRAERSRARGRIISLTSVTGGVGVTTLTASLALAMNQLCEKRIGVVDLDLQTAGLGVLLNRRAQSTRFSSRRP